MYVSLYFGQAKMMVARLKEHISHTKYESISESAIAEQSFSSKDTMDFKNPQIIANVLRFKIIKHFQWVFLQKYFFYSRPII